MHPSEFTFYFHPAMSCLFICGLLISAISILDHVALNDNVINELEWM